ncbi:MAG: hypothetical protein KAI66_05260 [Lentisphaeria bacterium]|nr:hypothetical protein [Lentisphaeria bacterium]
MGPGIRWCLFAGLISILSLTGRAEEVGDTRAAAIAKARHWLQSNGYARALLDASKEKDLLNPESKVYGNSVAVSDDLTEVRFHHNGNPYDSDSITFVVTMDDKLSLVKILIHITPGGHE